MSVIRLFPIPAIGLLFTAPLHSQTAGVFEPFTHQTNANSWTVYDRNDGGFYLPSWDSFGDGSNPDIFFPFLDGGILDFYADAGASGGAFVGDLVAGGVDVIGADIYVEDVASYDFGEFYLFSSADNRYYVSNIIVPAEGGWSFATASLVLDDWFVFEDGAYQAVTLTAEILENIEEVGFSFYPVGGDEADGAIVALDNFTFYGAFILPALDTQVADGAFQLQFDRRPGISYTLQSSPDLESWSVVPGQQEVTGNGLHTVSRPISGARRFFRVGIEDFLTPVPQLPAP